ncbi:enoyl-CoA hydratase/isomerase family protein [Candidimonas sp. SYP-B2681]|uniref:enoyl-CoA hydratase/isomerase family protein n=1 Tax=Candidimonas sp. SYP-B2681 TaxID=2497686 RepID=UPI000F871129|nr:enoyl-CoA hydratase/isomerase family protein [Candidimonas sp. SYP-B2681]RTZ45487.1 enoyl-CoA hydratase/isomerase family protein [Candidimonas sp. SYP-B2681]
MSTPDSLILSEQRDSLLWLTLNRPTKANALTVDMTTHLTTEIARANKDPSVNAVVLTAAGERIFCAGVDIREKPADGDMASQREARSQGLAGLQDAVLNSAKPVIVALNGTAVGAGAMIALLADACVAAESASISLPEIDIGIPTFSGANILEVIGGRALALDLILSGRRLSANEGLHRGIVRAVVDGVNLQAAATDIASGLGAKDVITFGAIKPWINRKLKAAIAEARLEHTRHREHARQAETA